MGSTSVLSAPDGPHVGPMNFAIWVHVCKSLMFDHTLINIKWHNSTTAFKVNANISLNKMDFKLAHIALLLYTYTILASYKYGFSSWSGDNMPVPETTNFNDVIISAMASQITSVSIVCSIVDPGADQIKHQSSASWAFVWGIHRWPVNSPHKRPVTRKMFPFNDVIMK